MSFCDWFISLNVMSSKFIHAIGHVRIPFLLKADCYSTVCMYHIWFIQLYQWTLQWLLLLTIVNKAAMKPCPNISSRLCLQIFGVYIQENYWIIWFIFKFLRNFHMVFLSSYTILHSSKCILNWQDHPFLKFSSVYLSLLYFLPIS